MEKKIYYLAYGSNLNVNQMKYRCPHSIIVGSTILEDYELEFRTYLNIKKSKGKKVPVGVWLVNEQDEKNLDRYEGYPTFYKKEYIPIEINGKTEQALVYVMVENVRPIEMPTRFYYNVCLDGYKSFKFKKKYLDEALESCSKIIEFR